MGAGVATSPHFPRVCSLPVKARLFPWRIGNLADLATVLVSLSGLLAGYFYPAGPHSSSRPVSLPFAILFRGSIYPKVMVPPDGPEIGSGFPLSRQPHASSSLALPVPCFVRPATSSPGAGSSLEAFFRFRSAASGYKWKVSPMAESRKRIRPVDKMYNGDKSGGAWRYRHPPWKL